MRARRDGVALVVVLILLAVASLLAVAGMAQAILDERIAGNQRQVAESFKAAEAGLLRAAGWWQESTAGQRHDRLYWNDPDGAMAALQALDRAPRPGLTWSIVALHFEGDDVLITSRGQLEGGGTVREVAARYRRPRPPGLGGTAPLTLGGPLTEFSIAQSALLRVDGDGEDRVAPALLTASEADAGLVRDALTPDQLAALTGGVEAADDAGGPTDPAALQALLEILAQTPGASVGPVPWDLGTVEAPAINVVRGADGGPADLRLSGTVSGAGILIVTGDLFLERPPEFTGLILVLGGRLEIGAGRGHIRGSIVLHGIEDTGAADWVPSPEGIRFHLDGELELERSSEALELAWNLLPPAAQALWEALGQDTGDASQGRLYAWSESPRL
jgi:type II secretory pathway pseudopilin PulG